jgi:glycosyltransferase involved in cell wall biosynthesis
MRAKRIQSTVSLCAVVKDSLPNVRRLLTDVRNLVGEIVIVDTGSPASVISFEKEKADKVFQKPWRNDFAVLRNFAIGRASSEWILALDSDESLTESLKREIPKLIKDAGETEGFRFHRIHYVDEPRPLPDYWAHLRLYRRHARYFGAVHESIKNLHHVREADCPDCFILHHNSRRKQRSKALRYSRYLRQKIRQAETKGDRHMIDYYRYKLWVQDSIYLPETDPNFNKSLLKKRYREYEEKKKAMEGRIKRERWPVDS